MRGLWVKTEFNSVSGKGNNRLVQSLGSRTVMGGSYVVKGSSSTKDLKPLLTVVIVVAIVLLLVVVVLFVKLVKKNHKIE